MSTLYNAAKDWSDWERRGFREQITQAAEDILVEELKSYITQQSMNTTRETLVIDDLGGERPEIKGGKKEMHKFQDGVSMILSVSFLPRSLTERSKLGLIRQIASKSLGFSNSSAIKG